MQGPEEPGGTNVNLQVRVGGNSGAGGDGSDVEVDNSGSIATVGNDSIGIHAYSVGGGGGDAGQASGMYIFPIPFTDRAPLLQSVSISVGGTAEASGGGGKVTVNHSAGDISSQGAGSSGIYAQSVGAGGGMGGTGAAGATGTVAIGGTGGAAGDGGAVTVNLTGGSISTAGGTVQSTDPNEAIDSSYGIFAQSVGGGGGHAGNATFFGIPDSINGGVVGGVTVGIGFGIDLAGGNAGNGGPVGVTATGAIQTAGPKRGRRLRAERRRRRRRQRQSGVWRGQQRCDAGRQHRRQWQLGHRHRGAGGHDRHHRRRRPRHFRPERRS